MLCAIGLHLKKPFLSVLAGLLLLATPHTALAQSNERLKSNLVTNEISGDVQLLSHYIEHGLSMSDGNPAMNASFLYNIGGQVRVGFWGSNISNLSAQDDNFWFKFLGEFGTDVSQNLSLKFYLSDNHFYKSDIRNGQRAGVYFNYTSFYGNVEWTNNLEGTHSSAEYVNVGKLFNYGAKIRFGGDIGYTFSSNATLKSFFDARALARYLLNNNTTFEAGATYNSYTSYFGKRADPAYYVGAKISY